VRVVFYAQRTKGLGDRLRRLIEALVTKKETVICRTVDSLSGALRQPQNHLSLAVLIAASEEELNELVGLRDLLEYVPIVLVLPNRRVQTIAQGHRLRPRFLTDVDSDWIDIAAVLSKMLSHKCACCKGTEKLEEDPLVDETSHGVT
jgi:hypothetical protein